MSTDEHDSKSLYYNVHFMMMIQVQLSLTDLA